MKEFESTKTEQGQGWDNMIENPDESWAEHVQKANELAATKKRRGIDLSKPKFKYMKDGELIESSSHYMETFFSKFDRYEQQQAEIKNEMQESFENGTPLKVLNIGVANGQEALGYVQMASDIAGEQSIDDALDLELVEYAQEASMVKENRIPDKIKDSSINYLKHLYDSPKAHFGTPFQDFVKELKAKGEKRDVVLFNNVIQHLDYSAPNEQMLEDMQNLADVVADGGMLCMSCNQLNNKEENIPVKKLYAETEQILKEKGFEKMPLTLNPEYEAIYKKVD